MADSFKQFHSKIAGVNSGPEVNTRQRALGLIRELHKGGKRFYLDVVPDPENEYDVDALQIMAEVPEIGRVQLGFVGNGDSICRFCGSQFERFPKGGHCKQCGHDDVERDGLASKISRIMRENPALSVYAEVAQVTGGEENKPTMGANIQIRLVTRAPGEKQ